MLVSVLIDSREPPDIKQLDFGVPTIVTALDAGDVIATCNDDHTLVIERKTPSDLLGSIKDGRLFQQCHKMRALSEFCYLAIIGRMDMVKENKVRVDGYRITGWNWDSVQGALLTIQEIGIGIVYGSDFKSCIERLARRERDGVTIHPRRQSEPMTPDEAFLASLPGIGAMKAKEILGHGPACWALDWLTDIPGDLRSDTLKIPGIGWKKKVAIRDVLGLSGEKREYLTVNIWESKEDGK